MSDLAAPPADAPVGSILPWFSLPRLDDGHLRSTAYRGRANLVVVALPEASEAASALLRRIAGKYAQLAAVHAQPIAIVGGTPADAARQLAGFDLGFPVVIDEAGRLVARLTEAGRDDRQPVLYLTDRYLEIRLRRVGWEAGSEQGLVDLLDCLSRIDHLCSV